MKKLALITGLIGTLTGAPYSSEAATLRGGSIPIQKAKYHDRHFCNDLWRVNLKKNQAKYNIDVSKGYVDISAWGVHKKRAFCYQKRLILLKNDPIRIKESFEELEILYKKRLVSIDNNPVNGTYADTVKINGFPRGKKESNYFEKILPYKPWKKMKPIEKAHRILHNWRSRIGASELEGKVAQIIENHGKKLDKALDDAR